MGKKRETRVQGESWTRPQRRGASWDVLFVCYLPVMSSALFLRTLTPNSFQPVCLILLKDPVPQTFGTVLILVILPRLVGSLLPHVSMVALGSIIWKRHKKTASNNNCLGPGFHVLVKLFGRNEDLERRHDLPVGLGWADRQGKERRHCRRPSPRGGRLCRQ